MSPLALNDPQQITYATNNGFFLFICEKFGLDARVKITIEIEAEIPSGAPENVVRTVTENCRTLKFDNQGFEEI